ncbi:MAG: FAD-dependent oxidoreductase [Pseudomonadota bacterium]
MKIAVVGSGVSGLGAALALSETHDVQLFEKDARFGGHANTVDIDHTGARIAVDTGFIVFNDKNYPNLCGLFDHLDVPSENSNMSFAVSLRNGALEYGCGSLDQVFAQRWRVVDPGHLRAFRDVMRFNQIAPKELATGEINGWTLGDWMKDRGFSRKFRENFLLAMGGAIWSTSPSKIESFPARAFVQFFKNHELMSGFGLQIQWRTVTGGSREYVQRVLQKLGPRAQAGVGVDAVTRLTNGQVKLKLSDGSEALFDQVVLATHPDQSLKLLIDADVDEFEVLSSVRYSDNVAVLHRDPDLMPKRRKVWSSWNVISEAGSEQQPASVTYWMNRLQNLDATRDVFVSLNPVREPDPDLVFGRYNYAHPLYDQAAFDAQTSIERLQGRRGVWYAGAWLGWGFHEDGLKSALRVTEALGARPTWARDTGAPLRPDVAIAAE